MHSRLVGAFQVFALPSKICASFQVLCFIPRFLLYFRLYGAFQFFPLPSRFYASFQVWRFVPDFLPTTSQLLIFCKTVASLSVGALAIIHTVSCGQWRVLQYRAWPQFAGFQIESAGFPVLKSRRSFETFNITRGIHLSSSSSLVASSLFRKERVILACWNSLSWRRQGMEETQQSPLEPTHRHVWKERNHFNFGRSFKGNWKGLPFARVEWRIQEAGGADSDTITQVFIRYQVIYCVPLSRLCVDS